MLLKEFLGLHDLNTAYEGKFLYHICKSKSDFVFESRWNKFVQRNLADRGVHEQLQLATKPSHYAISPTHGLPRLLLQLF